MTRTLILLLNLGFREEKPASLPSTPIFHLSVLTNNQEFLDLSEIIELIGHSLWLPGWEYSEILVCNLGSSLCLDSERDQPERGELAASPFDLFISSWGYREDKEQSRRDIHSFFPSSTQRGQILSHKRAHSNHCPLTTEHVWHSYPSVTNLSSPIVLLPNRGMLSDHLLSLSYPW